MTRRSRGGDPGSDKSPGGGRLNRKRSTRYTPGPADPEYDLLTGEPAGYTTDPLTADWWAAVCRAVDRGELEVVE